MADNHKISVRNMKKCLTLLFAASSMLLFNACENEVFTPERVENTKDLVAPADFDWKTTQSQTYNLISKVNTVVSIYTDKDCTDESLLIENLVLNANEATDVSVNIPTYVTSIFVQYPTEDGKEVFEINTNGVTTRAKGKKSFVLPAEHEYDWEIYRGFQHYYYPSKTGKGTLMFEDLYPAKGDYDFNDFVAGYNISAHYSLLSVTTGFTMKFQIRAIGSSLALRPAIRLKNFKTKNIKEAKVRFSTTREGITMELLNRGDNEDAIFVINGIESLCSGGYYNTLEQNIDKEMPVVTCEITRIAPFSIFDDIATDYRLLAENLPKYFDFFIQKKDNKDEIHFYGFNPTGMGNQSTDTEFKTEDNLVWAIGVPQEINHPAEKEDILNVYPKFKKWVLSRGTINPDWYKHPEGPVIKLK